MASRVSAYDFSIPELLRVLNEKLGLEYTRVIRYPPVLPTNSLAADVRVFIRSAQQTCQRGLTVDPSDRKPRNQGARRSETYPLFTEHVATCQQTSAGNHLSCRPIFPRQGFHRGHGIDDSTDSCVPILARVHHFDTRKLDTNIQQEQEFGGAELTTGQGSTPGNLSRHASDQRKSRVL